MGALLRDKDVDRLVRAFAQLNRGDSTSHLLIVGDGPDRQRLVELSRQLGCSDSVTFAGEVVDTVSAYFEAADVFVLPGLGGLAISEAMTHGLPVICGRGDGCEVDFVRDGETGFRLTPGSSEEVVAQLTRYLTRVLQDDALRLRMGADARRLIEQEHNVSTYLAGITAAIRYAVTSNSRQGRNLRTGRLAATDELSPGGEQ